MDLDRGCIAKSGKGVDVKNSTDNFENIISYAMFESHRIRQVEQPDSIVLAHMPD